MDTVSLVPADESVVRVQRVQEHVLHLVQSAGPFQSLLLRKGCLKDIDGIGIGCLQLIRVDVLSELCKVNDVGEGHDGGEVLVEEHGHGVRRQAVHGGVTAGPVPWRLNAVPSGFNIAVDLGLVELADAAPGRIVEALLRPLHTALVQQLPQRQPNLKGFHGEILAGVTVGDWVEGAREVGTAQVQVPVAGPGHHHAVGAQRLRRHLLQTAREHLNSEHEEVLGVRVAQEVAGLHLAVHGAIHPTVRHVLGLPPASDDEMGFPVSVREVLVEGAPECVSGGNPRRKVLLLLLAQSAPQVSIDGEKHNISLLCAVHPQRALQQLPVEEHIQSVHVCIPQLHVIPL
mmetsp:Transcript_3023/g.8821  ORF Transcript_3023/g.8821 Transcript_3023/m.8821 type:complete len:344 (-) Transcript_3023:619-1650(-)